MKKRLLAGLLVVCMLLAALPMTVLAAGGFSDVSSSDWFADEVAYVSAHGLMNGVGGDKFGPNLYITRGMLVTILYRMAGSPYANTYTGFTDVDSGAYFAQPISWAVRYGIVTGYGNGKFGPNDNITREQLAAILYRYADHMGENVDAGGSIRYFSDYRAISDYAYMPMIWAVERGLIGGSNGKLMPQANATRAQVAAIIYRYLTEEPVLGGGLLGDMMQNATHKHSYATTWSNNETHHWHAADCGHDLKADEALHVYGSDYSCTVADECDVCGYEKAAGEHTYGDWTTSSGRHTRVCSSCGDIETAECTYPSTYTTDAEQHWKVCEICGVAGTKENHDFAWVVDTSATTTTTGVKHEECSVCGLKRSENTEIPMLPHVHSLTKHDEVPATCEDEGTKEYWTCSNSDNLCSGKKYGDKDGNLVVTEEDLKIDALGHDWGTWTYDSNDTHKRSCSRVATCGVTNETASCTGDWLYYDADNHRRVCADCANPVTQAHTYDDAAGVEDYTALTTTWTCTVATCAHEKVETGVAYIKDGAIYDSISAAITAATAGETVVVPLKAEAYSLNNESLDFQSKAITVQIEGVSGTTLNMGAPAGGEKAAIGVYTTVSGSKLIVKNVSITGSETAKPNDGTRGIGISGNNNNGLVVEIDSCAFANLNSGIYLGDVTKATITNSTFTGCNAGIGGSDDITDTLTVTGCTFTDCPETIGWAGAETAKLVIEQSTISEFTCWHNGELKVDVTNGAGEWTGKTCHEVLYIYNLEQLQAFADAVNGGNDFTGKTAKLMNNINMASVENWTPIGGKGHRFNGTFDGGGNTISNLTVNNNSYSALFGDSWIGSSIQSVNLENVNITSHHYAAAVVGHTYGDVMNCTVDGLTINCTTELVGSAYDNGDKVGGIAGWAATGEITGCTVKNASITGFRDVGGILGHSQGDNNLTTIQNCKVEKVTLIQSTENPYTTDTSTFEYLCGRNADVNGNALEMNGNVLLSGNTITDCTKVMAPGTLAELQSLISAYASGATGNITIELEKDFAISGQWEAYALSNYNGVNNLTIDGNGHKITGLNDSLLRGSFAGDGTITIKDLTLEGVTISGEGYNGLGLGAFIAYSDSSGSVVLENCHLTGYKDEDGTVTTKSKVECTDGYAGGLIGYSSTPMTVTDCSVTNTVIKGGNSSGCIIGHAARATTISGCTITNNDISSTDDSWRVGIVGGTFDQSSTGSSISGITRSGNTLDMGSVAKPDGQNDLIGRNYSNVAIS